MVIAPRTVLNLLERYDELVTLSLTDTAHLQRITQGQGRVVLALDGLQPDVSHEVLWVVRDCLSTEVLVAHAVQRGLRGVLGALTRYQARARTLAPALAHFRKVSHSYWPGLFHCYHVSILPRTNNALEQFFGAHRYHERQATRRKVASPALVLTGSVRVVAAAATRIHPFTAYDLIPDDLEAWQTLRSTLATRRQHRTLRLRFRRAPATYLARLESDFLQLSLPPWVSGRRSFRLQPRHA